MSQSHWPQHVAHAVHMLHTESGKQAVAAAGTALVTVAPTAAVAAGFIASTVALPAVAIGALGYGLYRLFK